MIDIKRRGERLNITPKATLKLPDEKGSGESVFWPLEGGLSTEHPAQADMFVREVRTADTA